MDLISELTEVGNTSWQARNENPRFNFGGVLTSGGEEITPIAWARLLLPESWAPRHGHDARRASLVLHIELDGPDDAPPNAASLVSWHQCFAQALRLPMVLAAFLEEGLSLSTSADPPTEVALWLEASTVLTELVDIDGLGVVPGSPQSSEFTGYAVAATDGQDRDSLALTWLRTMCDSRLHLTSSVAALASLAGSDGPPLRVTVTQNEWQVWRHQAYIVALQIELTNTTGSRIQLGGIRVVSEWGGSADPLTEMTPSDQRELDQERGSLGRHRYSPGLSTHGIVEPHDSVSGWLVISIPWLGPRAGTPQLTIRVREAVGREYLTVIPRK